MIDWITLNGLSAVQFLQQNPLWLMFSSAFLSATVLPGNSEIIFLLLTSPFSLGLAHSLSLHFLQILFVATLGNSFGSMTSYLIGRYFLPQSNIAQSHQRALSYLKKYGLWALCFSWLPVLGDVLCVMAGWLKMHWFSTFLVITLSKFSRYAFLFWITHLY